mgnify:FL=1|tara:strand:+ start:478 stop:1080 length:603 start_codon:yes stop_codon:yes gene_type:complete
MSFNNKTKKAAKIMFGEEHEREMNHPLKQVGTLAANAGYNAMEEINRLKNTLDPTSTRYHGNTPQGSAGSVALPSVNMPDTNFTLGTYASPQSTTDSDANDNSNTINPYSFMDDDLLTKEMPEHVNKFGFHKRNLPSLDARYKKALNDGKLVKAERLKKKIDNFKLNQQARSQRNEQGERTNTGTGFGNFLRKINPQNWL